MRLTENEIRDVNKLLLEGKPLPDEYRFLLFEDKREVELVWNGKSKEVCNIVLPFQTIENVDEPRPQKVKSRLMTLADFDTDTRGRQSKGWTNKLIWGDNKLILSSLKNGPLRDEIERNGGIKLIYIDPPFDVGADFSFTVQLGDDELTKQPSVLEDIAYRDTWGRGPNSFLCMLYERLKLMKDLLAKDGSIFVHCDWHVGHYIRACLDEVFGKENFVNEVVWYYYNKFQGNVNHFACNHDVIFWYRKGKEFTFNIQKEKRDKPTKLLKREWDAEKGAIVNAKDADGKCEYILSDEKTVDDVWRIPMLQPADKTQNTGFPTQKPEAVVKRIVEATTNPGEIVADFFCGAGTTLAVAEKCGRKWIGCDLGKFSIHTSRKRLIGVQRELKKNGDGFRAFEVLNLGKYERQHYVGINPGLTNEAQKDQMVKKEADFTKLILNAYQAENAKGFRTFHGKKNGRMVCIGPINLPVTRQYVEEVILECRENKITNVDVLAFEYEMGLFPNIQEEAKRKGISLVLKYIPQEVFDKRAVEKHQVIFHDVAYIEVTPHVQGKKVWVELTDFSVYYNQDSTPNPQDEVKDLKPGKSKIIVSNGKILKLTKIDSLSARRQVLTEKWSDWIDYWAVDFDFENRKEIINVQRSDGGVDEIWTGGYVFENEWQSFRTRSQRELELRSVFKELAPGKHKVAVKVVDIFGNDTMKVVEIHIGGK